MTKISVDLVRHQVRLFKPSEASLRVFAIILAVCFGPLIVAPLTLRTGKYKISLYLSSQCTYIGVELADETYAFQENLRAEKRFYRDHAGEKNIKNKSL